MGIATLNRIGSVQLDVYVSFTRGRDGRLICCPGVNVDILQGHVGGGVFLRCDGDGVVCGPGFAASRGAGADDGIGVRFTRTSLRNDLACFRSIDGNITVFQVPAVRQDEAGDEGPQQHQRQQSGHDFFHREFLLWLEKGVACMPLL